ncbi:SDR family NAD(P)-dependent oxidoreductase [Terriglobus saanensis]|uniref:Short-chain dehydrogenase/reductase SDR n=1 Tax=Terriglobus saanensis (strain ATCC BAA-1853 / DSM 23119 / SP1PR4) TaxID=401053 RepID=E8V5C9_TERSS|nr:3-oxoacyl-ACP reductase family protein [Terriglobus saanensis]ADV84888.1 short-chain dehydrogenase/reductase SDR [Terriglobus saanensis SP1PR4]
MSKPLENKLALVTGSSRGIGAAIAVRLAAEGAYVLVNYSASPERAKKVVDEITKAGGHAEAVGADLGSLDGPKTLIASIDTSFGGKFGGHLDILVNNAGTAEFGPFLETSDQSYDKLFNVNVRALIELSKDAAKRMTKSGWGRIINIGSAFGEAAPMPGVTLYIATKFAVHGFTRGLSRELGATGVTVNGVQPGPTNTELSPDDNGPAAQAMKKLTSVGRFGKAEEIAAAVAFLASPESSFINGENLTVDGGWNA